MTRVAARRRSIFRPADKPPARVIHAAAHQLGMSTGGIRDRVGRGWTWEEALNTPLGETPPRLRPSPPPPPKPEPTYPRETRALMEGHAKQLWRRVTDTGGRRSHPMPIVDGNSKYTRFQLAEVLVEGETETRWIAVERLEKGR